MPYLLTFALPFLGPFFREQPFKGIAAFAGWCFLLAILIGSFGFGIGMVALVLGLLYLPWGWRECHNVWNYRRHGFAVDDHL